MQKQLVKTEKGHVLGTRTSAPSVEDKGLGSTQYMTLLCTNMQPFGRVAENREKQHSLGHSKSYMDVCSLNLTP